MTNTISPALFNVRTISDLKAMEDDPLERYEVPENWLLFELLGLSNVLESVIPEQPEAQQNITPALPKRPFIVDNLVNRAVPLFLRL